MSGSGTCMSAVNPRLTTSGALTPGLVATEPVTPVLDPADELDELLELLHAPRATAAQTLITPKARARALGNCIRAPLFMVSMGIVSVAASSKDGAAVDAEGLTGDVGGAGAAKPRHQRADVVGRAEPARRNGG